MDDYILLTRKEDFIKEVQKLKVLSVIISIPMLIAIVIVSIISLFNIIFSKEYRKDIIKLYKHIFKYYKKDEYNRCRGCYVPLNHSIYINLQAYKGKESDIEREAIETIIHEDLHKVMNNEVEGNQEFIIKKMGG